MSDMRNIHSENSGDGKHLSVVVRETPLPLVSSKINWLMTTFVVSLMAIILLLGVILLPTNNIIENYQARHSVEVYRNQMNPVLSAEINTLKGQLIGLLSGSIESKLRTLEESVRLGAVSMSLGTIEDLKNDVKVLRAYSTGNNESGQADINNELLLQEVNQLKKLIYLIIASCGLMLAAVAGVWVKNRQRLPFKESQGKGFLGKH